MTLELTESKVAELRQRDGDKAEDRNIKTVIDLPQLGYNEGEPLVGDSYDGYPNREELANPEYKETLRELAEHPRIGGADDLTAELTGISAPDMLADWVGDVEAALELFEVQITPKESLPNPLEEILGYEPANSVVENRMLLDAKLYERGLSVAEIEQTYDAADIDASTANIESSLTNLGLIPDTSNTRNDGKKYTNAQPAVEPVSADELRVNANDFE